ncbi:MAG TPA: MFS transporter, partial [Aggregatilineales bacterium]|nr:MFS transporter [Aggregatilineales bacterium]
MAATIPLQIHDPYAALRYRDFRLFIIGRFIATLGEQMVTVAIGWELYERTNSELALGLVGLVEVLPVLVLALPAGHVADRFVRKYVIMGMEGLLMLCMLGLAVISYTHGPLPLIYLCLLCLGISSAFNSPASSAFLPQTIPAEMFSNAATWNSTAWQLASVIGPALGGVIIALQGSVHVGIGPFVYTLSRSAGPVYLVEAIAASLAVMMVFMTRTRQIPRAREATSLRSLAAGVSFVRRTKVFLAAITLDMFAVLLGGATILLPVFAKDILAVGP